MNRYFLYDPEGDGFSTYKTEEERDKDAVEAIEAYKEDGWNEEVTSVCAGEVTLQARQVDKVDRPPEDEIDGEGYDKEDEYWDSAWTHKCNYELKPVEE